MKKCPFCSAELQDDARFCYYCMQQLDQKTAVIPKANKKNNRFWVLAAVIFAVVLILVIVLLIKFGISFKNMSEDKKTISNASQNVSSDEGVMTEPSVDELSGGESVNFGVEEGSDDVSKPSSSESTSSSESSSSTSAKPSATDDDSLQNDKTQSSPSSSKPITSSEPTQSNDDIKPQVTPDWKVKEVSGGVEIEEIGKINSDGVYIIPSVIDGKNVVGIGEEAFLNSNVKRITLPNTVKYIGEKAFYGCKNLTSITLPASVAEIRTNAFANCSTLAHVYISGREVEIATYAFSTYHQRNVDLTIHAPSSVMDSVNARVLWDAAYQEWNG